MPDRDLDSGVAIAARVIRRLVFDALVDGWTGLQSTVAWLAVDRARWALAAAVWWDARSDGRIGAATIASLRPPARESFAAALAAVERLPETELRAALLQLVWFHVDRMNPGPIFEANRMETSR